MPNETAPEHGADIGSVRVTIGTVSGRARPRPTRRVGVPAIAMIAMVVAVAVATVGAPGGGRRVQAPAVSRPMQSAATPSTFGLGIACPRLVVFAPGGGFARVDVDRFSPCGTYGNYVTIVLRRVRGSWVRALEMSAWTCRSHPLPRQVLGELGLCLRGQEHTRRL